MLIFRIICALFVAWAMNWAVSRPEADGLREAMPEFILLAPIAGGLVGYFNLATRQGWGSVVAVANGMWSGFLSLILTSVFMVTLVVIDTSRVGEIDFAFVMGLMAQTTAEIVDALASLPLIVVCLGATTVAGLVTEVIHWALVRIRKHRGIKERNTRRAHRPSMY